MEENIPVPAKKKPGRPKKLTNNVPLEMFGIAAAPANEDDGIELIYRNPFMFKKIIHLCKQFTVAEIEMIFDPTGIKIECADHLKKSRIYIQIDGQRMNWYYCKENIRICVRREQLEKVLSSLGKNHYKITFILKDASRSILYIIIYNQEYETEEAFEIDILHNPAAIQDDPGDNDTDYPLKFRLAAKFLKSTVNNFKKMSSSLIIRKCGIEPLMLMGDCTEKITCSFTFSDPAKINLHSDVAWDDIFNVSVCIDYISPFSASGIGDDVTISVDKYKNISFTTQLDNEKGVGCTSIIKIFTEINDCKIIKI